MLWQKQYACFYVVLNVIKTWQYNIKTRTGLSLIEAVRATKDRSQWRKIVLDAAKPRSYLRRGLKNWTLNGKIKMH